jgi:hypothetical protein
LIKEIGDWHNMQLESPKLKNKQKQKKRKPSITQKMIAQYWRQDRHRKNITGL